MTNNTRNPQAEALFRKRYNGHNNVMTPRIYARRMIGGGTLAIELSNGEGVAAHIETLRAWRPETVNA